MDCEDPFLCHQCGKIFDKLSSFTSHLKWKHMEKTNDFMCDQCGRIFQKKYNLHKHLKSGIHFVSETVKCALCDFRALNRKIVAEHYQSLHFVTLKESSISFKTLEEFYSWKSDFENKTNSRFVKMSSSRKRKSGLTRSTFFCHRDGNFSPKGRNLRHLKVKGSNKINAHCPAKIEVDISERIVIVNYIDTHLGHELDMYKKNLNHVDKALIAEKLALKVPLEHVLEELNNSMKNSNFKCSNLLTKKDLWSIVDAFKINPKSIVCNKKKSRRKEKTEKTNKRSVTSKKKGRSLKLSDSITNSLAEDNTQDEENLANTDSINNESNNVIVCPVVFKYDENNQFFQEYAIISHENDDENNTCLIINAQGEVETINGQHIICTENGEIQVYETLPENKMLQKHANIVVPVTTFSSNDFGETSVLRTVDSINENGFELNNACEQISSIKKENCSNILLLKDVNKPSRKHFDSQITSIKSNFTSPVCLTKMNNIMLIKDQAQLSVQEVSEETYEVPESEVTISYLNNEDSIKEECVINTENENTDDGSSHISCNNPNNKNVSNINLFPVEEITLNSIKAESKDDRVISEQLVDDLIIDERNCAVSEWNEKKKLLNEKIFSNNITSMENVLKLLSKDNKHVLVVSDIESFNQVKNLESNEFR